MLREKNIYKHVVLKTEDLWFSSNFLECERSF